MGDSGSLMLGYLLATLAIEGVLKTAAAVSLVFPLVVLALPILDTSFVILKRLKYRQPIYQADRWHFHHRFANIGFSQRRTALTLYAWCIVLSAFALAIRFVPPHRHGWSLSAVAVLGRLGLVALLLVGVRRSTRSRSSSCAACGRLGRGGRSARRGPARLGRFGPACA